MSFMRLPLLVSFRGSPVAVGFFMAQIGSPGWGSGRPSSGSKMVLSARVNARGSLPQAWNTV